jgi:hypothetical protein
MATVFDRRYELVIGSPEYTYSIYIPESNVSPSSANLDAPSILLGESANRVSTPLRKGYLDYRTVPLGAKRIEIQDLHMEAEIKYGTQKTSSSTQPATVKLYNASPDTYNFIKSDGLIFLKAGYSEDVPFMEVNKEQDTRVKRKKDTDLPLLFTGKIDRVYTEKDGKDTITYITCKDLGHAIKSIKISKSYTKNTLYKDIIQDLLDIAASRGVPTGFFVTDTNNADLQTQLRANSVLGVTTSGVSIEGNLIEELSELCSNIGYIAYIAAGKIYVEPSSSPSRIETIFLGPDNIKGFVRPEEDSSGVTSKASDKVSGVRVNTFLNAGITLNKLVKIETGDYAGFYKISSIKHILSYEGSAENAWDTEITATRQ